MQQLLHGLDLLLTMLQQSSLPILSPVSTLFQSIITRLHQTMSYGADFAFENLNPGTDPPIFSRSDPTIPTYLPHRIDRRMQLVSLEDPDPSPAGIQQHLLKKSIGVPITLPDMLH